MAIDPKQVQAAFLEAVAVTPDERAGVLDRVCAGDAELRYRVELLIRVHDDSGELPSAGGKLEGTGAYEPRSADAAPRADLQPGNIFAGRFKLREKLGEGGMGIVWVADQTTPVQRRIALKVIKSSDDSHHLLARFEQERQALALMDHPNIAKVLDAGVSDDGRPYFVMDLIKGVPLTKYCDAAKLTPHERLELFVPVCQAVQHAHQKGVIHRDLKPSNILVGLYDGRPVPKVIDFGVAKATGPRLSEQSIYTEVGTMIGTLEYMSPEQAALNNLDIDTRSDVYSLGAILYELLTGSVPFSRKDLKTAGFAEMLRIIKEVEPPKPSTRLSGSGTLPSVAASRHTEPKKLTRLVRGELDWIVMKCLEKDRSRRFETANGLARDIERYLADEVVEARPPSARYRLSKFARKYKTVLATAAAFAILLVAGMVLTTLLAVWATSAEREANRQRIASDDAKTEAMTAKTEADRQRVEADTQRDEARLFTYAAGMGLAQRYWENDNIGRARELLEEVPREVAGRNLRGFEWHYLHRLCHSEALSINGQAFLAWSTDGQRLATRSITDGSVKIWESSTGKELLTIPSHSGGIVSIAFSPDGQRLASGSEDSIVKIWDSVSGKELLALRGHAGRIASVAFSPDGQRLASASYRDNTVKIWDSATGQELFSLKFKSQGIWPPTSLAFSPDGQRLATGNREAITIWDSTTGKEHFSLKGVPNPVNGAFSCPVVFSPDSRRLASGSTDTVKIWDSATGQELFSLGHTSSIFTLAFSPDGQRLASGSWDSTVKIWDSVNGKELLVLRGHAGRIESVAFSPDGQRLASGSEDSIVKIWDSVNGKELLVLRGHAGGIASVAFSPDSQRLASASLRDNTVKIWDSDTAKEVFSLDGRRVWSLAFSPDSQRLALGCLDNTVKIWDRANGKELLTLRGHAGRITSVAFSPDGQRLTSASDDKTVKIWDCLSGKELFTVKGTAYRVAFSPVGQRLALCGGFANPVRILDSATGQELISLKAQPVAVWSVAFSPDGQRLASGGNDKTVKIWDSMTGQELFTLKGHTEIVSTVMFSPDGRRLASGSHDQTVKIWDSMTGQELFTLKGHFAKDGKGRLTGVTFSPDGQRLASASQSGNSVKIWDVATGKELFSLTGRGDANLSVAFSPDGQCLAALYANGSVLLWETTVSTEMQRRRDAFGLVADLFKEFGLRADVLDRLRTAHGISPAVGREALAAAQVYPENPSQLNELAWERVKVPGREISDYRKALRYSEAACLLEPNDGGYLNTLGVVHYRLGDNDTALKTLLRSDQLSQNENKGSVPEDLAFLAMTQQRLGHTQEAQNYLRQLRERVRDPRWAQDAQAQGFLREAEALLAEPTKPDGK